MRGGRPIKARARRLRAGSTDAERALWRELRQRQLGYRFRRQFPIPPYIADFACLEARLIVEADGGQHNFANADRQRDEFLTGKGWRVLRFWNNDILQNRAGVLQLIAKELGTHPHPNPPPLAGEGVGKASENTRKSRSLAASTRPEIPNSFPPPQAGEG
ncbi:MAG TPA: endonuclease domain-containing protein [Stellaceae bacterium]|nr:endonuclease domain-containing protein [Stellaceae bacterium]